MGTKPLMSGELIFEVERSRYEELIAAEEELRLLKNALARLESYSNIDPIKEVFGLNSQEVETNE